MSVNARFKNVITQILENAKVKDKFDEAFKTQGTAHVKINNKNYMPLTIEAIGINYLSGLPEVSVCHYGKMNGDLMRDPEMIFEIHPDGHWIPNYFRNDYVGIEKQIPIKRDENGMPVPHVPDGFAPTWAKNIKEQGFIEAAKISIESLN